MSFPSDNARKRFHAFARSTSTHAFDDLDGVLRADDECVRCGERLSPECREWSPADGAFVCPDCAEASE